MNKKNIFLFALMVVLIAAISACSGIIPVENAVTGNASTPNAEVSSTEAETQVLQKPEVTDLAKPMPICKMAQMPRTSPLGGPPAI